MLDVKMFGSFEVTGHGGSCISLTGRPRSLFAYLLLHRGRFFSRAQLLESLWPDNAHAQGVLNTTLWRLRKTLESVLPQRHLVSCTPAGELGVAANANVSCDLERFVALAAHALAKPLEQSSSSDVPQLRAAVELYRADILCNLNDEWALRERERHRRMYLSALKYLVALSERDGHYDTAIHYAQQLLECDVLREDVHRELMSLYVSNGQHGLALKQYEHCRALLKRELLIEPTGATQQLYRQIANGAHTVNTRVAVMRKAMPMLATVAKSGAGECEGREEPSIPRASIELVLRQLSEAAQSLQLAMQLLGVAPASPVRDSVGPDVSRSQSMPQPLRAALDGCATDSLAECASLDASGSN